MNKFYYLHIAPIICRIFGHKWDGLTLMTLVYGVSIAEGKAENGVLRYTGNVVSKLLNIAAGVVK